MMWDTRSFSPLSFSPQTFFGTKEPTGRSGYWRLFYHQLQEQALKDAEQKPKPKFVELEPIMELSDGSAIVGTPRKDPKPAFTDPLPTLPPLPRYRSAPPKAPEIMGNVLHLQFSVQRMFMEWSIRGIISSASSLSQQREDEEELLLLLAA